MMQEMLKLLNSLGCRTRYRVPSNCVDLLAFSIFVAWSNRRNIAEIIKLSIPPPPPPEKNATI